MNKNYRDLVSKVDSKVEEILGSQQKHISCKQGCHSCCLPNLSISRVEAESIAHFIRKQSREESLLSAQKENPWEGSRCSFLNSEGACSIYEARPIICRSHGVPVRFRDEAKSEEGELSHDVCHLNFVETSLEEISQDDFINLELINTLLALINAQVYGKNSEARISLNPEEILASGVVKN